MKRHLKIELHGKSQTWNKGLKQSPFVWQLCKYSCMLREFSVQAIGWGRHNPTFHIGRTLIDWSFENIFNILRPLSRWLKTIILISLIRSKCIMVGPTGHSWAGKDWNSARFQLYFSLYIFNLFQSESGEVYSTLPSIILLPSCWINKIKRALFDSHTYSFLWKAVWRTISDSRKLHETPLFSL